ncbi:MAG: PfkB family carbohydrate kinase [Syntrophomonadaceae bacterium]|jgi:pseudouridine kinase
MRLTAREKEIYDFLKKDPLITQEDLAGHFGITRSSVAVHISNLMKKGYIMGRGYVFNEQVSAVVVGETFLQILVDGETGKNTINYKPSGFAFEVSNTLARFGINVKIVTVIGDDHLGSTFLDHLQKLNVDTTNVLRYSNKRSARRVFVGDEKYEESFDQAYYLRAFQEREWVLLNCQWLIIDWQFQEQFYSLALNKEEERLPNFCSFRMLNYPEKIPDYLEKYYLVVLGTDRPEHVNYYSEQLLQLSRKGLQNAIITDGKTVLVYIRNNNLAEFPLLPNQSFETHNRLPFLLAGVLYGLLSGFPLRQSIRIGVGVATSMEPNGDFKI